jgi:Bacterial protein of unknown function (DUF899)
MPTMTSAPELAAKNPIRHPNESVEYRTARQELLVEEIELRRQIERVAALRRGLPPGGELPEDYRFIGEDGAEVTLSDRQRPVPEAAASDSPRCHRAQHLDQVLSRPPTVVGEAVDDERGCTTRLGRPTGR